MLFRGARMRKHMMCEAQEVKNWKVKTERWKVKGEKWKREETNKFKLTIIINQN